MVDKIKEYVASIKDECIPQVSINCVIFGFRARSLQVVVNRMTVAERDFTVLPGGFVKQTEDLSDAVTRIVKESTGLEEMLFRQFAVAGTSSRSFGDEFALLDDILDKDDRETINWFSQRFISVCYLALVQYEDIELQPTQFLEAAEWSPVTDAETLAMDHSEIARQARETLARELPHTPIEANLLPSRFTLPELHALFESILDRKIDRPNFRRKMLQSGRLRKVGQDTSGGRRPADLYSFESGKGASLIHEYKLGF